MRIKLDENLPGRLVSLLTHLECFKLTHYRQHSIRVNQQYRITFRWEGHDAHDVCCEDYH